MNTKDAILIACAFLLGIVVSNLFFKRKYDCTYKVITNVDTLYVQKVDTIFQKDIEYVAEKVVDTLYITSVVDSVVKLPITQKHYAKDSIYDAWVSGVNPSLDSIKTYNNVYREVITQTETITKDNNKVRFYPYIGAMYNKKNIGEKVGIAITTKKRFMFSCEVGLMDGNAYYGANVGIKIN